MDLLKLSACQRSSVTGWRFDAGTHATSATPSFEIGDTRPAQLEAAHHAKSTWQANR
jgi:hypothetical protein